MKWQLEGHVSDIHIANLLTLSYTVESSIWFHQLLQALLENTGILTAKSSRFWIWCFACSSLASSYWNEIKLILKTRKLKRPMGLWGKWSSVWIWGGQRQKALDASLFRSSWNGQLLASIIAKYGKKNFKCLFMPYDLKLVLHVKKRLQVPGGITI